MSIHKITLDVLYVNLSIFFQKLDKVMDLPMSPSLKSGDLVDAFIQSIRDIETESLDSDQGKKQQAAKNFLLQLLSQKNFAKSFGNVLNKVMTILEPYLKQQERLQRQKDLRGMGPKWARAHGMGGKEPDKVWDIPGGSLFGGGKSRRRKKKVQRGGVGWVAIGGIAWILFGCGAKLVGTIMFADRTAVLEEHIKDFAAESGISIRKITYYLHLEEEARVQEAQDENLDRIIRVPGHGFTTQRELNEPTPEVKRLIGDWQQHGQHQRLGVPPPSGVPLPATRREQDQFALVQQGVPDSPQQHGPVGTSPPPVDLPPPPPVDFPIGPDVPDWWKMQDGLDVIQHNPQGVADAIGKAILDRATALGSAAVVKSHPPPLPQSYFEWFTELMFIYDRPTANLAEVGRVSVATAKGVGREIAHRHEEATAQYENLWGAIVFEVGRISTASALIHRGNQMVTSGIIMLMSPYVVAHYGAFSASLTAGAASLASGAGLQQAIIAGLLAGNAPAILGRLEQGVQGLPPPNAVAGHVLGRLGALTTGTQLALTGGRKFATHKKRRRRKRRRKTKRRRRKKRKTRSKRRRRRRRTRRR